ncbi:MAG: hypothetical protein ACLSB9_05080 [Hydrogeniiclostridium mannosilyticum]
MGTFSEMALFHVEQAKSYAITNLIPEHFAEVKSRREAMVDKTAKAVKMDDRRNPVLGLSCQ